MKLPWRELPQSPRSRARRRARTRRGQRAQETQRGVERGAARCLQNEDAALLLTNARRAAAAGSVEAHEDVRAAFAALTNLDGADADDNAPVPAASSVWRWSYYPLRPKTWPCLRTSLRFRRLTS